MICNDVSQIVFIFTMWDVFLRKPKPHPPFRFSLDLEIWPMIMISLLKANNHHRCLWLCIICLFHKIIEVLKLWGEENDYNFFLILSH